MTFRVALHYVRPDDYHLFMSCDVVVEWNLTRDLSRFVAIVLFCFVKSLHSWNRNNILVLRKPDIRIGVIIGLIGTSIVEFARDSFELGNNWREVHRELKLEESWIQK